MNVTAKSWVRVIGSTTGAALAGPGGAILGILAGGLLTTALPGLPGFLGEMVGELTASTAEKTGEAVVRRLSEEEKSRINHDLQTAFRDAFREAIYDVGGEVCFPKAWRRARLESPVRSRVVYSETPQGEKLWRERDVRAEQVCDCLHKLERAVIEGELLPLEPPKDQPAADVRRYLEAEAHQDLSNAFFKQVMSPYLESFRSLVEELAGFEAHLRRHLLDRTLVHVGELLKDPSRTQAWRAFNRLMLEGVRGEVRQLKTGQREILNRLDVLLERPGEPSGIDWTDGLADLLAATARIEKQVDEGLDDVQTQLRDHDREVVEAIHRLQQDISRLVRMGRDGVYAGTMGEGRHIRVEPLPPNYLERPEELSELRRLVIQDDGTDDGTRLAAVLGMGGIGKSVLVSALCHDPEVQEAFPDGVIFVEVGREPGDLVDQMKKIGEALDDPPVHYTLPESSASRLGRILESKKVLIALDNVWEARHVERFRFDTKGGCIVFSTRKPPVVNSLGAARLELGYLKPEQAVEMLRQISGADASELAEIAKVLWHLPLALRIVGSLLREDMTAAEWLEKYRERVFEMKLDPDSDDPHASLEACFDLSTERLKNDRLLYNALGIFRENVWIPTEVVLKLWRRREPRREDSRLLRLIDDLSRLALIEVNEGMVGIHDLLHDYNRHKLGDRLAAKCHSSLLSGYNPGNKPWYELTDDGYLFRYLPYHLVHAGRSEELFGLLAPITELMESTLDRPALALEGLLISTWKTCWREDKARARRFLIKEWLRRPMSPDRRDGYTARVVAVRCAFEVGYDVGLAAVLCHRDKRIRSAAMTYMYYLSKQAPERAVGIVETLSRIAARGRLPNVGALQAVFLVAPLVAIDQFQQGSLQSHTIRSISALRSSIQGVTSGSMLRFLGPAGRAFVVQVGVQMLTSLLRGTASTSVNNLEGLKLFFAKKKEGVRQKTIEALDYLDREHPHPEDVPDVILGLYQRTNDRVSGLLGDFIIAAHGTHDLAMAGAALERFVAELDDPGCLPLLFAAHNWYSIVDRQDDADVTDSALETMKGFVTQWLDSETSKQHGYGAVYYNEKVYPYHPLAYYTALWTKAHPDRPVDLLHQYAERAEAEPDRKLERHIIDTFGDFRCIFYDYPTALRVLTPYIQKLPSKDVGAHERQDPIWQGLVASLGGLRGLYSEAVDAFLEEVDAPAELVDDILCHSYLKPSSELYFRSWQILADVVAYAPPEFVRQIIDILREALSTRSIGRMVAVLVNRLIELAEARSAEMQATEVSDDA